jgi:prephenate dehydrogenase
VYVHFDNLICNTFEYLDKKFKEVIMTIMIIGALGVLGSALVEHCVRLGFQVICVDLHNVKDLKQLASNVAVAFIATPISEIAQIGQALTDEMKAGSLIASFGSVAEPSSPHLIDFELMKQREITFCHLHFMFRPIVPLRSTIFGQNIAFSFDGKDAEKWKKWLPSMFEPYGPVFHEIDRKKHDQATVIGQLVHMTTAVMVAGLWNKSETDAVNLGIKTGGFPSQSVTRSVLRSMQAPKLIGEILRNHPLTLPTLAILRDAIDQIEKAIEAEDPTYIIQSLQTARNSLDKDLRDSIDWTADKLIRLEADLYKANVIFEFPAEMNKPGLLARVLGVFDRLGINKTSTFAHNKPNGGCMIIVGVENIDRRVKIAEQEVRDSVC